MYLQHFSFFANQTLYSFLLLTFMQISQSRTRNFGLQEAAGHLLNTR